MAAARDVDPVYFERYMIDYNSKPPTCSSGTAAHPLVLHHGLRRSAPVLPRRGYRLLLRGPALGLGLTGDHRSTAGSSARPATSPPPVAGGCAAEKNPGTRRGDLSPMTRLITNAVAEGFEPPDGFTNLSLSRRVH